MGLAVARAGNAAHILRRFRQRIEVAFYIKEDGLVDHAAHNGGEHIIYNFLVRPVYEPDSFAIHSVSLSKNF